MTKPMDIAMMRAHRSTWIASTTLMVENALFSSSDRESARLMLVPEVTGDSLTQALALTHIAAQDRLARSFNVISAQLIAAGIARTDITATQLIDLLIWPVVRRVRESGAPSQRWWDVKGLHALLLELWTAHRRTLIPEGRVHDELTSWWLVGDDAGRCCIESERGDNAQRSGGNLRQERTKKTAKRSIASSTCPFERPSGGSRMG